MRHKVLQVKQDRKKTQKYFFTEENLVEFKEYFIKQGQQLSHRAKLLIVTIRKSFVFYNHESHVNYGIKQQAEKVLEYSNTVCFFYADKNICSFDPLKIVSGQSNISQNLRIPRTFDKNTPRIFKNIFLRYFSLISQKKNISLFQSTHGLYTIVCHSSLNSSAKMINILLECLKKKQF